MRDPKADFPFLIQANFRMTDKPYQKPMESTARAASQYFGDLFMSLIPTCQLCGANSFGYLIGLQRHTAELAAHSADWVPWNYRDTLAAAGVA